MGELVMWIYNKESFTKYFKATEFNAETYKKMFFALRSTFSL